MTEILIIRPQSIQLGDTICSLPMFKALKNKFSDSRITFIGCPTNYDVNITKLNPYIDEFIVYKKEGIVQTSRFFLNLRKKIFDYVIVPTTIRISSTSYLIAMLAKGKKKIGFSRLDVKKNGLKFVLDEKIEVDWQQEKAHQVYRFLESVKPLGCEITSAEIKQMRIGLSDEDIQFGNSFAYANFPDKNKKVFGFHPGGGKTANIWDVNNYFELIKKINRKYNPYIIITSGFLDARITEILESRLKASGIAFTTIKDMDTYSLAAVIQHMDVYISNDTGVMHLAAFAGTKTLSVFRNGESKEWQPLFNNSKSVESKTENINDITVEEVLGKFNEFFN